jgi:hypothetical protein
LQAMHRHQVSRTRFLARLRNFDQGLASIYRRENIGKQLGEPTKQFLFG